MDTHKTLLHNGENYIQLQVDFLGVWDVRRKKMLPLLSLMETDMS